MSIALKVRFRLAVLLGLTLPFGTATAQTGVLNWQRIEADNGAAYAIDLSSISRFHNGTAQAVTCVVDNGICLPPNMSRFWFDCNGHYRDLDRRGPTTIAPPRSVVGRMAAIACKHVEKTTPNPTASPNSDSDAKTSRRANEDSKNRKYNIRLTATRSNFPNIVGATDLPDGTKLLVSVNKTRLPNAKELLAAGLSMCEENCLPASGPKGESLGVATTVLSGAFSAGPFSWAGKPFRQGAFEVEVYLVSLPGEDGRGKDLEIQLERMKKPIQATLVTFAPQ